MISPKVQYLKQCQKLLASLLPGLSVFGETKDAIYALLSSKSVRNLGHYRLFVSTGTRPGQMLKFRDCPGHSRTLGNYVIPLYLLLLQDSKSHHERELKAAEQGLAKAKKDAQSIVGEAKANQQEMQALQLELEELTKSLETQQQQVAMLRDLRFI